MSTDRSFRRLDLLHHPSYPWRRSQRKGRSKGTNSKTNILFLVPWRFLGRTRQTQQLRIQLHHFLQNINTLPRPRSSFRWMRPATDMTSSELHTLVCQCFRGSKSSHVSPDPNSRVTFFLPFYLPRPCGFCKFLGGLVLCAK